ncbi:hypothetical protein EHM92_00145 [bacterium]|nr:MAG: hypothetical protein EHM92_00145 [bacterium]
MASKFTKAKSKQAYLKMALYGGTGSGKTLTSLLISEGLAKLCGKRVAYIDTENGSDFYATDVPERLVHPMAFDFDRIQTAQLMDVLEAVETLDTDVYGVVVIDQMTTLWEAARAAYNGKKTVIGGIPIQAWGDIKRPYKRIVSLTRDGNYHSIYLGREGMIIDKDEDGEMEVIGTKMKAEGETAYEPHILGRMKQTMEKDGNYRISVFFEKDRSGVLTGRTFNWPNFDTIKPVVKYLTGVEQNKLGTAEENAEKDVEAQEREAQKVEAERRDMYELIRSAILNAKDESQLKTAWALTNGKKGKLGDLFDQLQTMKDSRKAELREAA